MSYKGVPFAAPPVGALRRRPPQPPPTWTGERSAVDYGFSCPQPQPPEHVRPDSRAASTREDCLTLNVWVPLVHPRPLPVMVFVHGGSNDAGTGSQTYYDGTSFARDDVMLVSINYRLGVLGLFAHPSLDAEPGDAPRGNYGLLDQIAALRWVRANAAAFGGDPANVTVFGESSGGEDIVALATAALAHGLFGKAIVESCAGLWDPWPSLSRAEREGANLATILGLPGAHATAAQLRAVPVDALARLGSESTGDPIVDGRLIVRPAVTALDRGFSLPMIVGVNDDDGSVLGDVRPEGMFRLPAADFARIRAAYATEGVTDDAGVARRLFRDGFFSAPARWVASHGSATFLYRFDYVMGALQASRPGASHGSEIPFVFESWSTPFLTDADRQVDAAIHGCWVAFARTGAPDCPGVPLWPAYVRRDDRQMVFGAAASVQPVDGAAVLDILERDLATP